MPHLIHQGWRSVCDEKGPTVKLNLGCGTKILAGYCNVDKYGEPDLRWDLEKFPWPWENDSVDEIILSHVLEHLGKTPDQFIEIMKEIYRISVSDAIIKIVVPHPRHDYFISDPTHVRPITPKMMSMFSKKNNVIWQEIGCSNSTLALYHDVDFEMISNSISLDEPFNTLWREGKITSEKITEMVTTLNNIATEIHITLKAKK